MFVELNSGDSLRNMLQYNCETDLKVLIRSDGSLPVW